MSNKIIAICIKKNKEVLNFKVNKDFTLNNINNEFMNSLPEEIKSSNNIEIERECDFDYDCENNKYIISLYAWNNGIEGEQNLFDLPPPIDNQLYYNNIYLFAHKDNKLINFTIEKFKKFYNKSFGGFDDLGLEDSWSEEESNPSDVDENGNLINFIDDSEIIENNLSSESEYELSETDS
jgi:hypothetical protein